jgi:hypothetical protein
MKHIIKNIIHFSVFLGRFLVADDSTKNIKDHYECC